MGAIGTPILLLWKEQATDWVCTHAPVCPGKPEVENIVAVSTLLPRCWRGYLSFKLRRTPQTANWGPGTDNLAICGNGQVSAQPAKLLETLAEKLSRCLVANSSGGRVTINLNQESGAVCRVPYVAASSDFTKSTLEYGVNICVPEAATTKKENGAAFVIEEIDGRNRQIFECDESLSKAFGF
jgi:hypothetical protein